MRKSLKNQEEAIIKLKEAAKVNKPYRLVGWFVLFTLTYQYESSIVSFILALIGWHILEFTYILITNFHAIQKLYSSDD